MNKSSKAKAAVLGLGAAIMLTGCSVISTAPNERALHYDAGPFSSTQFENCVHPGTREFNGPADEHYTYPAGQRNYQFIPQDGDAPLIEAFTSNPATVYVEGVVSFQVASDCDTLREFHERIGAQHSWTEILNIYLGQPTRRAVTEATNKFTWEELLNDDAKKREWEQLVKKLLPTYVDQAAGGDYFSIDAVTLQKPRINADLQKSIDRAQQAVQDNLTQSQRNETIRTELDSVKELVEVLGVEGYIHREAIINGNVQVLPVPSGSDVIVGAR